MFYPLWMAAALALQHGTAYAKPMMYPDYCPNGVATLIIQPIEVVTKIQVLVSKHCPYNGDLVIDDAHTVHCTSAPTDIDTVITVTETGSTTLSRYGIST